MPTPFDLSTSPTIQTYQESGWPLPPLLAPEAGDLPQTVEAVSVGKTVDHEGAQFKKERAAIYAPVTAGDKTFKGALPDLAALAQDFRDWLLDEGKGSPSLSLKVMKVQVIQAGAALLESGAPGKDDMVAALQTQEDFRRTIEQNQLKRLGSVKTLLDKIAAGTASARERALLWAVANDLSVLSDLGEAMRSRISAVLLELSDPAAYRAYRRASVQMGALESLIGAAARAVASDASLQVQWTPAQLAQREKEERWRKTSVAQRG